MDIKTFIKENQDKTYGEIAKLSGHTVESVRKHFRRMGLEYKHSKGETGEWKDADNSVDSVIRFLSKAKNVRQLIEKYGREWEKIIRKPYDGYTLFEQRNEYNEPIYLAFPKIEDEVEIMEKDWTFHKGKDAQGKEQPYLLVNLPRFKGTVTIAPLFDIHYGNAAHRHEKFLSYIQWIATTPGVYQDKKNQTQLNDMIRFLAPIAHKILLAIPGNHEARTEKTAGIDVMAVLANALKIPYFNGPVWMTVMANGYKRNFWVHHGTGNSQTKGGKMNMASRPKAFTGLIHFFVSGHVHDCVVEHETLITDDPVNFRLVFIQQWVVIAQSFLEWHPSYAYKAEFRPPATGGVSMELGEDGEYKALLT